MASSVYFIRVGDEGPIKIGTAIDVAKRLSQLQTGHYEKLQLLASIPGDVKLEKRIHAHLSQHRIRGEWFRAQFDVHEVCKAFSAENETPINEILGKQISMFEKEFEGELFIERVHAVTEYWKHRLKTEPYFIDETIGEVLEALSLAETFEAIDAVVKSMTAAKQLRRLVSIAQSVLAANPRETLSTLATFDLSLVEGFNEYEAEQEGKK